MYALPHRRVVPRGPHPQWYDQRQSQVVFHVRGNTLNNKSVVRDLSRHRHAITASNVAVGATDPWIGDYFTSTGTGVLSASLAAAQRLTNTDFDVEFVFRSTQNTGVRMLFATHGGGAHAPLTSQILIYLNAGALEFAVYAGSGAPPIYTIAAGNYADGRWHKARMLRRANTFVNYIDGVQVGTGTHLGAINDHGTLSLFQRASAEYPLTGDIHACRVTTGSTRFDLGVMDRTRIDWPNGYPPVLAA
jgi:hypothetical protein